MERRPSRIEQTITTLSAAGIRFVVVGGVAIVLHGHLRATVDLDLVLDLEPANVLAALRALEQSGLKPLIPVDAALFADPTMREAWMRERNMIVFSLRDPDDFRSTVDLFLRDPLPFDELFGAAVVVSLGETTCRIASRSHLIAMKHQAGRPQDLADIEALLELGGDA